MFSYVIAKMPEFSSITNSSLCALSVARCGLQFQPGLVFGFHCKPLMSIISTEAHNPHIPQRVQSYCSPDCQNNECAKAFKPSAALFIQAPVKYTNPPNSKFHQPSSNFAKKLSSCDSAMGSTCCAGANLDRSCDADCARLPSTRIYRMLGSLPLLSVVIQSANTERCRTVSS